MFKLFAFNHFEVFTVNISIARIPEEIVILYNRFYF